MMRRLLNQLNFYIMPVFNVDGYHFSWTTVLSFCMHNILLSMAFFFKQYESEGLIVFFEGRSFLQKNPGPNREASLFYSRANTIQNKNWWYITSAQKYVRGNILNILWEDQKYIAERNEDGFYVVLYCCIYVYLSEKWPSSTVYISVVSNRPTRAVWVPDGFFWSWQVAPFVRWVWLSIDI